LFPPSHPPMPTVTTTDNITIPKSSSVGTPVFYFTTVTF
jgi:hypothetical protein